MKENKTYASEPVAMTYGMSDYLINSGLLTQISELSTRDKQCLISYISEEVELEKTTPYKKPVDFKTRNYD